MVSSYSFFAMCLSLSSTVVATPRAQPGVPAIQVVQHVSSRGLYQGGFPLGLGAVPGSCPADASVQCPTTSQNENCCPAGQTCFYNGGYGANYCCPTDTDCYEAVKNYPRCADYTWNMFIQSWGGYFCCPPGKIAVNPVTSPYGGICESPDQVVPKSLLATMVSQVGAPTPTPSATATGSTNATATGTTPTETNPSLPGSPSTTSSNSSSPTSSSSSEAIHLTHTSKLAIGLGVVAIVVFLFIVAIVAVCRRNRRLRIIEMNNTNYNAGYDRFGNPLGGYGGPMGGYEPYRRVETPAPNNVTVNVVQGDLQGDGARL